MGYYANYRGSIETKPMSQQDVKGFLAAIDSEEITGLLTEAPTPCAFEQWEVNGISVDGISKDSTGDAIAYYITIWGDEKYYDDDVRKFLNAIAPYTKSGEIEYNGEDNTLWRFAFRGGEWYEDSGYVSYVDSAVPLSGQKEDE